MICYLNVQMSQFNRFFGQSEGKYELFAGLYAWIELN